jgi:CDK-activating kinase assembly factor MAT1
LTIPRLNKTESDFTTLKDYNDYLETVEEVTWNLILKIDVEATERRLRQWEEAQRAERNASTTHPSALTQDPSLPSEKSHVVLKKGAAQRKVLGSATKSGNTTSNGNTPEPQINDGFNFKGLKAYQPAPPPQAYDPFDGFGIVPQYYTLQPDYDVEWLTKSKHDPVALAAGVDISDFYSQALCDAFSGFGVFVEDEMGARNKGNVKRVSGDKGVATQRAEMAAKVPTGIAVAAGGADVAMDDVF